MRLALIISTLLACSCTGYRFQQNNNPLAQYGVSTLAMPMFFNYSTLPEVSSSFTRETYRLLSGLSGLKLKSGWSSSTDAVLIGIVRSPETVGLTLNSSNARAASAVAGNHVGTNRPAFNVPGTTVVHLMLQVVVIKRPSPEELQLLRSELGPKIPAGSKVIFNETFTLNGTFNREVFDDSANNVIATQNAGALRRTQDNMALEAAEQIRDMILYAF